MQNLTSLATPTRRGGWRRPCNPLGHKLLGTLMKCFFFFGVLNNFQSMQRFLTAQSGTTACNLKGRINLAYKSHLLKQVNCVSQMRVLLLVPYVAPESSCSVMVLTSSALLFLIPLAAELSVKCHHTTRSRRGWNKREEEEEEEEACCAGGKISLRYRA